MPWPMPPGITWWASPPITSSPWISGSRRFKSSEEVSGSGRLAWVQKAASSAPTAPATCGAMTQTRKLDRKPSSCPAARGSKAPAVWARVAQTGLLYTVDDDGQLFSFDEQRGFSPPSARPCSPRSPAWPLPSMGGSSDSAETASPRCSATTPASREVADLGVAVSLFERRRYGYVFGEAVMGRDGEIIFGEDDDGGHLWLYFPRIQASGAGVVS